MARWLLVNSSILASLWLCALLLLQAQHGGTAPTNHLTVSVEGNTPTLIVTSAEIGITPKIVHVTAATTTPPNTVTAAAVATASAPTELSIEQLARKSNLPKLQGKSHKLQYGKKWQHGAKAREKGNEKISKIQNTSDGTTFGTFVTTDKSATTKTNPPILTTQTIKPTTTASVQYFEASSVVATLAKGNSSKSSVGSLASEGATKPLPVVDKPSAQDEVSTPDAIVFAVPGNLPRSTEVATEVTLPPTAAAVSRSTPVEAAGSISEVIMGTTSVEGAKATSLLNISLQVVTTPGVATKVEGVTETPAFIELHDTTAAETTKYTSTAAPTPTPTLTAEPLTKKPISTTTSNAPMIASPVETLPKALTVITTTPAKTTITDEIVTDALPANRQTGFTEHQIAKTIPITIPVSRTDKVVGVSQSGLTVSKSYSDSSTIVSTSTEESSTNIGENLAQSTNSPSRDAAVPIRQSAKSVSRTPTSQGTVQEASTPISTTTTLSANTMLSTTKNVRTIQTNQKVNTESGIIFIDDVPDNREAKQGESEAELQQDEAIVDRHEDIKNTSGDADGVSGSDGIIKLIDLEKHDLKSISKAKQLRTSNGTAENADGHDGVKKTTKKQLTEKHYLLVPDISASAELYAKNINPAGAPSKTVVDTHKDTLKNENKNSIKANTGRSDLLARTALLIEASIADANSTFTSSTAAPPSPHHRINIEKSVAATPTLRPVHNGYLGPILMEEKRFTVKHSNKKPPHDRHESTIESQLRNGRFIEILAPTALLEQNNAAASKLFDAVAIKGPTTTTTSLPPQVAATVAHVPAEQSAPMLSSTVFQVPESMVSTTRLPLSTKPLNEDDEQSRYKQMQQQTQFFSVPKNYGKARTESKISDIQVEVYDSTVDSIVASTNFKDSDGFYALPLEAEAETHVGTTRPPLAAQERFTQYVVDRADYATQESSVAPHLSVASGKPEPAAIEIHINVSEGIGNESEDLEFSYRQADYTGSSLKMNSMDELMAKTAKAISMKPLNSLRNESSTRANVERGDEILVVEIIDTGENSTEGSISAENANPIFTFRSDAESDIELKDIKYFPPEVKVKPPQMSDELFLADLKRENALPKPPLLPPPPPRKPNIDRDSDTIFYISNTEVKVGESVPTANTDYEEQQQQQQQQQQLLRKTRLENQFFPANYLASTHPNAVGMSEQLSPQQHRYEEDIILSPLSNTADSLKIFRSQGDGAPPLDVTYVGESVMEVEQSPGSVATAKIAATTAPSLTPDVIIQPAILPEMSIGVPVIGELPPQIELKEIDFMPDEANQQHSGVYENNMLEENGNGNGNDVDRLVESSVQYGGDLIDESAGGGGFDGVEGSYPFGNPVALQNKAYHEADYAHYTVNHGVNNLRKDELSADVAGSGEMMAGQSVAALLNNLENVELKELLNRSTNETHPLAMLANGSYAAVSTERMSNATAYTVMEDPNAIELAFKNHYTLIIGIFIVLLPVVLTVSMTCAMWFLYIKIYGSPSNREANQANGTVANGKKGGEGESSQEESTNDTVASITKQQLPSSTENPTNGNCFKAEQNTTQPSSFIVNNITCNGGSSASGAIFDSVGEMPDEVILLPAEWSVATASLTSAASSLTSGDNNKSQAQANLSNNSVQENFTRPNGSVTKMTLKNNHLIVETEERHDISRVARETTMHYNTSEKDGVFVVEVARGVDSKSIPGSPTTEELRPIYQTPPAAAASNYLRSEEEKVLRNHEEIQIHQPPPEAIQLQPIGCLEEIPERSLHQIVELDESTFSPHSFRDGVAKEQAILLRNSNTGLSQSDLSSTSSTDSNKQYSYGNQELYTIGSGAYVSTSPSTNLPLTRSIAPNVDDDDDRRSENGHSLEHSPAAQGNGAPENAAANESAATCDELPKNEQINYDSREEDEDAVQRFEKDSQLPVDIVPDIGITDERISPEEESAPADIEEKKGVAEGEAVVDIKGTVDEVETTEQTKNIKEEAEEEIESSNRNVGEECINKDDSAECLTEQSKLPVSNDTDTNIILQIPNETEKREISDDDENICNSGNHDELMNEDNTAHLTFPQPIVCNYGYDSIISLPDPPSTEEIKQLADFAGVESNQLDSLPPPSPPPPPIATDLNDNNTNTVQGTTPTPNTSTTEEESPTAQLKLTKLLHSNFTDSTAIEHCQLLLSNGNGHDNANGNIVENGTEELDINGHEVINGRGGGVLLEQLERKPNALPNTEDTKESADSTGTGKVPETPLTPPESPPLSSPLHYTNSVIALNGMNGVSRGICGGPMPVAVDVNGS